MTYHRVFLSTVNHFSRRNGHFCLTLSLCPYIVRQAELGGVIYNLCGDNTYGAVEQCVLVDRSSTRFRALSSGQPPAAARVIARHTLRPTTGLHKKSPPQSPSMVW